MEKEMDIELISDIAKDRLMSDLCIKWYLEVDEEKKKIIYKNEIIPLYNKLNQNSNDK
jgi:hypothetical protein